MKLEAKNRLQATGGGNATKEQTSVFFNFLRTIGLNPKDFVTPYVQGNIMTSCLNDSYDEYKAEDKVLELVHVISKKLGKPKEGSGGFGCTGYTWKVQGKGDVYFNTDGEFQLTSKK
jgi:hypothetical protein